MKTLLLISLLVLPTLSGAAVYKWVDDLGHVHYGNVPPKQQEEYKQGSADANPVYKPSSPRAEVRPAPSKPATQETPAVKPAPAPQAKPEQSTEERMRLLRERILNSLQSTPQGRKLLEQGAAEKNQTLEESEEKSPGSAAPEKAVAQAQQPAATELPAASPTSTETTNSEAEEAFALDVPASEENAVPATDTAEEEDAAEQAGEGVDPQQHAAQMCGVFTGFVEDYKLRIKNECSGDLCITYQRQLEKYRKKQQKYCGQAAK